MIATVIADWAAIAALLAAAAVGLAALGLWRAIAAQGELVAQVDARLTDFGARLDAARAARRDEALADALAALRDDVSILFTHVSALTSGQLDIKKIVSASVGRQVAALIERLDDVDGRAAERAILLRERVEAALGRAAKAPAGGEGGAAPAPSEAVAAALERIEAALAERGGGAPSDAAALAATVASATAEAVEAALRRALAEALAETLPGALAGSAAVTPPPAADPGAEAAPDAAAAPAAPRRAPSVFDSGRVVTLVAPKAAGEAL